MQHLLLVLVREHDHDEGLVPCLSGRLQERSSGHRCRRSEHAHPGAVYRLHHPSAVHDWSSSVDHLDKREFIALRCVLLSDHS